MAAHDGNEKHVEDGLSTPDHAQSVDARSKIVTFDGPDDPYRPINWPTSKKLIHTAMYGLTTMTTPWASSVYSPAMDSIAEHFGVSKELVIVGLSLCLFEFGPLVWAPMSEAFGRKWPVLGPVCLAGIFALGTATAKDVQTILITRFFTGFFGSAPVSNTGGVLADMWAPTERGYAIMGYSLAVIVGPTIAPVVGGAVIHAGLDWRWTQYLAAILTLVIFCIDLLVIEETYEPVLLVRKAARLRASTGDWSYHAEFEEWMQNTSIQYYINKFAIRPFAMLVTPICFFIAVYASFIFGVFYATLAAFPVIYEEGRGWNKLSGSFPFLALLVGIAIGSVVVAFNQHYYNRQFRASNGRVLPETRLLSMMFGSFFFAAGLFIIGWTAEQYSWILSFVGIAMIGYGFFTIFQSALNYLVDTFKHYGASAIAANTFLRSTLAGVFPLFIGPMYHKLGTGWATSVFGFFAFILIPIPFILWKYGPSIRKRGKYSAEVFPDM